MVAEVIGDGKYARDLPVLAKLFTHFARFY